MPLRCGGEGGAGLLDEGEFMRCDAWGPMPSGCSSLPVVETRPGPEIKHSGEKSRCQVEWRGERGRTQTSWSGEPFINSWEPNTRLSCGILAEKSISLPSNGSQAEFHPEMSRVSRGAKSEASTPPPEQPPAWPPSPPWIPLPAAHKTLAVTSLAIFHLLWPKASFKFSLCCFC